MHAWLAWWIGVAAQQDQQLSRFVAPSSLSSSLVENEWSLAVLTTNWLDNKSRQLITQLSTCSPTGCPRSNSLNCGWQLRSTTKMLTIQLTTFARKCVLLPSSPPFRNIQVVHNDFPVESVDALWSGDHTQHENNDHHSLVATNLLTCIAWWTQVDNSLDKCHHFTWIQWASNIENDGLVCLPQSLAYKRWGQEPRRRRQNKNDTYSLVRSLLANNLPVLPCLMIVGVLQFLPPIMYLCNT